MSKTNAKHKYYKDRLKQLFQEHPTSKQCKNRYKAMRWTLYQEYKEIMDLAGFDRMENFIKDAVYLDRRIRLLTEDEQIELKKELSQQYQLEHLGVEVGYNKNVKLLKNL